MLANAKSLIFTSNERLFFCWGDGDGDGDRDSGAWDWESWVDLRVDGFLDRGAPGWDVDEGRDERDRLEVVDGAAEARRDIAGDGGAGRFDVKDVGREGVGVGPDPGGFVVVVVVVGGIESREERRAEVRFGLFWFWVWIGVG